MRWLMRRVRGRNAEHGAVAVVVTVLLTSGVLVGLGALAVDYPQDGRGIRGDRLPDSQRQPRFLADAHRTLFVAQRVCLWLLHPDHRLRYDGRQRCQLRTHRRRLCRLTPKEERADVVASKSEQAVPEQIAALISGRFEGNGHRGPDSCGPVNMGPSNGAPGRIRTCAPASGGRSA